MTHVHETIVFVYTAHTFVRLWTNRIMTRYCQSIDITDIRNEEINAYVGLEIARQSKK